MLLRELIPQKTGNNLALGRAVRRFRQNLEMSQVALAKKAHLARSTVNALENGKYKTVTLESLEAVSSILGIPLKELFSYSEEEAVSGLRKGKESEGEFILDYPDTGFKIISWLPRRKDFFMGNFCLGAQREVTNGILPHTNLLFFETIRGTILISFSNREVVLKEREYLFFDGRLDYRLYNPHPLDEAKVLVTAAPSFL